MERRVEELHEEIAILRSALGVLSVSQDARAALETLAKLAVTHLADWCAVFTLESDKTIRRVAVARNGAAGDARNDRIQAVFPVNLGAPAGPGYVLRTGQPEVLSNVTPEIVESLGLSSAQLPDLSNRAWSYICVPLLARGRTIGAMSFVSSDPQRVYREQDLDLARDLAGAACIVADNARLYREAQQASRMKDEFVAMVSHELRTPLTPILGCIHLLRTAKLSEANFTRALEMIERNAQAQVQIVEDLLDISRIIAGKLHLSLAATDIRAVVQNAIESVQPLAQAKGLQLLASLDSLPEMVEADPARLQQIIWNLLSNGLKFTPPGGRVELTLKTDHDHVRIDVADTGSGISPDFLPFIFDRFRQADENAERLSSGLGLGLTIVRHLVELHHGTISAASPGAGQGAVFTLRFPLRARKAATATS